MGTVGWPKSNPANYPVVFCPGCRHDLNDGESLVDDAAVVVFVCSRCGRPSTWDFDTPVPIRVSQ
jgi:hypothetical protein